MVVRCVHEHGLRRDPGQLLHELARRRGELGACEDEIGRDDRDGARAVVEHERLRDHRVVDAVGEARPQRPAPGGSPHGGVMSTRATPAVNVVIGRAPFLVRSLTVEPSARRRPRAAASSARTTGSRARARAAPGRGRRRSSAFSRRGLRPREHRPVGREHVGAADMGAVAVEADHVGEHGVDAVVAGEEVVEPRRARPRLEQLLLGEQDLLVRLAGSRARRR